MEHSSHFAALVGIDWSDAKHCIELNGKVWLLSANNDYQPIEIREADDFEVWRRVLHSIKSHQDTETLIYARGD